MTTGLLDRAAEAAAARAGRDLYQWRSATPLSKETLLLATKVKGALATTGAAGGTLLRDVPLLKAGTFHGGAVTLDASDLVAMVERFGILAPDTFVPPVRIDHSFNVLNVIGHIADLRVAQRPDPSNAGKLTAYLDGDLQVLDDAALTLIQRGILRNRSSEIGPYEANTGDLHSLVMWGVAFVDIPAVEGLGPVPLSKLGRATPGLGAPHTVTALTEEKPVSEPTETPVEAEVQEPSAVPQGEGPSGGDAPGDAEQDQADGGAPGAGDQDAEDDEADDDQEDGGGDAAASGAHGAQDAPTPAAAPAPVDNSPAPDALSQARSIAATHGFTSPGAALRAIGLESMADQLEARDRADLSRQVQGYADRGLLGKTARPAAEALLGHHDSSVRDATRTLLDNLPAPVRAGNGQHLGRQTSGAATGPRGDDAPNAADLTASEDLQELGRQWAALTTAQRRDGSPEALAYEARRVELLS